MKNKDHRDTKRWNQIKAKEYGSKSKESFRTAFLDRFVYRTEDC